MSDLKSRFVAGALPALWTGQLYAEEAKPPVPAPVPPAQHGAMGAGMGRMMTDDMGAKGGMTPEMMDAHLRRQQEHLIKMHEYLHRIAEAKDDKEKARLKDEQLKLMREHMQAHHAEMQGHMQQMMKHRGEMKPGGMMQHGAPGTDPMPHHPPGGAPVPPPVPQ